ncbi:unnamed protein product, partial [Urochloa humidicola]
VPIRFSEHIRIPHLVPHVELQSRLLGQRPVHPRSSSSPLTTSSILTRCCYPIARSLHLAAMIGGRGGGRCRRRRSWISRIRRRLGVSKLSSDDGENHDIPVKADNHDYGEWICPREYRIQRRGHMRVDANGGVYVPDSEDEESSKEVEEGGVGIEVTSLGGASVATDGVQLPDVAVPTSAIAIGADGFAADAIDAAAVGVPSVAAEGVTPDGVEVANDLAIGEEMHPKVAARLKTLVAQMDPSVRDVFISMLKIRSINIEINSMHKNLFIFLEEMGLSF